MRLPTDMRNGNNPLFHNRANGGDTRLPQLVQTRVVDVYDNSALTLVSTIDRTHTRGGHASDSATHTEDEDSPDAASHVTRSKTHDSRAHTDDMRIMTILEESLPGEEIRSRAEALTFHEAIDEGDESASSMSIDDGDESESEGEGHLLLELSGTIQDAY